MPITCKCQKNTLALSRLSVIYADQAWAPRQRSHFKAHPSALFFMYPQRKRSEKVWSSLATINIFFRLSNHRHQSNKMASIFLRSQSLSALKDHRELPKPNHHIKNLLSFCATCLCNHRNTSLNCFPLLPHGINLSS